MLAFLSERDEGKTQVWLLNRLGGEAQRLTDTPQNVDDFDWSPDSTRLASSCAILPTTNLKRPKSKDKSSDADSEKAKKSKTQKPWVIDRLQFKWDEIGYLDRRRKHIYTFDLAGKSSKQMTSGDFDDDDPDWSPDGKLIAFASNRSKPDPDATYNKDIWTVASDNTDKGANLTQVTTNPGEDESPAWSPDGKWITYSTQLDPKLFQYATKHIAVSPASGGAAKSLRFRSTAWLAPHSLLLTASPSTSLPTMTAPKSCVRSLSPTARSRAPFPAASCCTPFQSPNPARSQRKSPPPIAPARSIFPPVESSSA